MRLISKRFLDKWKWYLQFGSILILLIVAYVISHFQLPGEERVKLTKDDISNIQSIINSINERGSQVLFDSLCFPEQPASHEETTLKQSNSNCRLCAPQTRADTITFFIDSYIRTKYPVTDVCSYVAFLLQFQQVAFHISFLNEYNLKVKSYFWLTENKVFLEIIFWTLFGVISSLFYHVSEALRTDNYNPKENFVHWAKIMYSPLISIIVYFSIESLIADGQVSLNNLRHGLVVLSFLLGFFSGRTIELVNKLKDLILPLGKTTDPTVKKVYSLKGVLRIQGTESEKISDGFARANVQLFSMNNPSFNDAMNPNAEGEFLFESLPSGEYMIRAEFKSGNSAFEGQVTVSLPLAAEEVVEVMLQQTTATDESSSST